MNRADKIAMFSKEIGDITDGALRKLATEIIACADDYFFTIPASSTGKNHPPFALGEGGLVRHTKCVVYMVEWLCESFNIDGAKWADESMIDKACKVYREHLIKFNPTLKEFPTALDEAVYIFRKQLEA